jgi:hypothetical protein
LLNKKYLDNKSFLLYNIIYMILRDKHKTFRVTDINFYKLDVRFLTFVEYDERDSLNLNIIYGDMIDVIFSTYYTNLQLKTME